MCMQEQVFDLLLQYADKYSQLLAKHTKVRNNVAQQVEELTEEYSEKMEDLLDELCEEQNWKPKNSHQRAHSPRARFKDGQRS